jgi:hypothetical protein
MSASVLWGRGGARGKVHPREGSALTDTARGSFPLGWGKLVHIHICLAPERFIPTWVGKASKRPTQATPNPVHPHVGGESDAMPQMQEPPECGWSH